MGRKVLWWEVFVKRHVSSQERNSRGGMDIKNGESMPEDDATGVGKGESER